MKVIRTGWQHSVACLEGEHAFRAGMTDPLIKKNICILICFVKLEKVI